MTSLFRNFCVIATLIPSAAIFAAAGSGEQDKKPVWSTVDIQLYGYIKLDAAYDTGAAAPGNFVQWIDLSPDNPDDDQFNMTASQTRLGLWLRGPDDDDQNPLAKGRVEIDFYGGGAENKPRPMLRHAYLDLQWRQSGWGFLAGQTSDVISPLAPSTVNYSVQWWAGNIGYRRPQIRVTKDLVLSESSKLRLAGALTRNIGSTSSTFVGIDAGADAGLPGLQARAGWSMGRREAGPIELGLSGHVAEEEFDIDDAGNSEEFHSWSVNLDFKMPLTDTLTLRGEAYSGENLAQYLGGIGQGVNPDTMEEIGDAGGWLSLDLGPYKHVTHHLGLTVSDVDGEDINAGDRRTNSSIFWNGVYSALDHVEFALELSYWETKYEEPLLARNTADDFRAQFAALYRF